jgi:hypothetical protein
LLEREGGPATGLPTSFSEEGILMADQYKCKKCGKISSKSGNCCGAPMEKTR